MVVNLKSMDKKKRITEISFVHAPGHATNASIISNKWLQLVVEE